MLDQLLARSTLYAAFERVRENGGCHGADGMTVGDFAARLEEEIDRLQDRLLRRVYHPFPLLRIGIQKPTSGIRHLSIPTVRDRMVQTAVDLVTRPLFEQEFEDCSHAYRCGRSVRTAIHRIRELRAQGYRSVVDADIDAFFDMRRTSAHIARFRAFTACRTDQWVSSRTEATEGATTAFSSQRSRRSGSCWARIRSRTASGTTKPRARKTARRLRAAS
jgi:RNA-directed DNA polymerase